MIFSDYRTLESIGHTHSGSDNLLNLTPRNSGVKITSQNNGINWGNVAKISAVVVLGMIAFGIVDEKLSARAWEIKKDSLKNILSENILSENILSESIIHKNITSTCKVNVSPHYINFDGVCLSAEITRGYENYRKLKQDYEAKEKIETRKEIDEVIRIRNGREREIDEFFARSHERIRRTWNPTEEEKAEDLEEANEWLDDQFDGLFGYTRRSNKAPKVQKPSCDARCQESAMQILNISAWDDCNRAQKQYHKMSLDAHPDRNGGNKQKFMEITDAYNKIC